VWDTILGFGTTPSLKGDVSIWADLIMSFDFSKRTFENVARIIKRRRWDTRAMTTTRTNYIRAVITETLAEQQRLHHEDIDVVVLKAIVAILTSFGIEDEDRREVRADLQHLRRWRKSVEQAQSYTVKAVITIIVTGFVGAMWLGIKALLGK
jgi:hypothetical protein